jgi:hypothetical protein
MEPKCECRSGLASLKRCQVTLSSRNLDAGLAAAAGIDVLVVSGFMRAETCQSARNRNPISGVAGAYAEAMAVSRSRRARAARRRKRRMAYVVHDLTDRRAVGGAERGLGWLRVLRRGRQAPTA